MRCSGFLVRGGLEPRTRTKARYTPDPCHAWPCCDCLHRHVTTGPQQYRRHASLSLSFHRIHQRRMSGLSISLVPSRVELNRSAKHMRSIAERSSPLSSAKRLWNSPKPMPTPTPAGTRSCASPSDQHCFPRRMLCVSCYRRRPEIYTLTSLDLHVRRVKLAALRGHSWAHPGWCLCARSKRSPR